jgi:CheY-like chemotaxis protein
MKVDQVSETLKSVTSRSIQEKDFSINKMLNSVHSSIEDIFWKDSVEIEEVKSEKELFVSGVETLFENFFISSFNIIKSRFTTQEKKIHTKIISSNGNGEVVIGPFYGDKTEFDFPSKLIAKSGGTIEFDNQEVKISFPLASKKDIELEDTAFDELQDVLSELKVLVIDDEEGILEIMGDIVTEIGCYCEKASNGVEALRLIRKVDFDLLFCDIRMPRLDGYELVEKIVERYKNKEVPRIVIVSANCRDYDKVLDAQYEPYILQYIDKPFTYEQLAKVCHFVASNKMKKAS